MLKIFGLFIPFILVTFTLLFGSHLLLDPYQVESSVSENGILEVLTAIMFAGAFVLSAIVFKHSKTKLHFAFMSLMALAFARELDWHKALTQDSVLKPKFYLSDAPFIEKAFGVLFITFLSISVFLVLANVKAWLIKLCQNDAISWGVFVGLGSIVFAKFLDGFSRFLPFLSTFKSNNEIMFITFEEGFEFIGASFFIVTAILLLKKLNIK